MKNPDNTSKHAPSNAPMDGTADLAQTLAAALTGLHYELQVMEAIFEHEMPRHWALCHLTTETGRHLDFTARPWMLHIWDDPCPRITIQKCTQVGATTWAYALAFHRAALLCQTVVYTMPTAADIASFVQGRINKVIDHSETLKLLIGRTRPGSGSARSNPRDNVGLKQFGGGQIYFRGTASARAAVTIPAHCLVHDEVDLSVPEVLEMYEHRLDALPPEERQIYSLSTPTVDGYGINSLYEASSRYEWHVRCGHCRRWEGPLEYWMHTEGHLPYLKCPGCAGRLDPTDPALGHWVQLSPTLHGVHHGIHHGYKLSRLMMVTPDRAGEGLLTSIHERRAKARFRRHFENMDLGETSSEGAASPTREQIVGACFLEPYPMLPGSGDNIEMWRAEPGSGPYFMGVDQGDTLTVVVGRADPRRDGEKIRVVAAARFRDPSRGSEGWQKLNRLMEQFGVRWCVVDGNPNSAPAHDFAQRFQGRVLVCYYADHQRQEIRESADVIRQTQAASNPFALRPRTSFSPGPAGTPSMPKPAAMQTWDISVDRTETLDRTVDDLLSGRLMLPGSPPNNLHPEIEELIAHVCSNVRRPVEDRQGTVTYRWEKKGSSANDYFHALNYLRVAVEEGTRLGQMHPAVAAPVVIYGIPHPKPR